MVFFFKDNQNLIFAVNSNRNLDELDISNLSTVLTEKYGSINAAQEKLGNVEDIKNTFANHYPKILFNEKDRKGILKLLQHDKKNKAGTTNFVLLKAIGAPQIDVQVPNNLFDKAFDFYADP